MLTIREIKDRTETFFKSKGVPNPRLDADTLIAHSLGMKRLELYLDMDRPLTEAQLAELRPLVKRRAAREPLQYILETVDFSGMLLKVDRRALIPRHETEELVEHIGEMLNDAPATILDLGTGSGALALALARKYPEAAVTAVDASGEALALAQENAAALELSERVRFYEGSWFEPLPADARFDLIVANAPYLTTAEMATAEPEVMKYEPKMALVSGTEGLDDLRVILRAAGHHLNPSGLLALETGIDQSEQLKEMASQFGLKGESHQDLSGRPRFLFVTNR